MARDFLHLNENPFDIAPQPRFFHGDPATLSIYDGLLSAVDQRTGLSLLVGEQGTGKTTLLLKLQGALAARGGLALFPRCAESSFDGLLKSCCEQLGIGQVMNDRIGRVTALVGILGAQFDAGGTAAILLDDAHALPDDALENFSLLADLEKADQRLVQVIFAGEPALVPRLCGSEQQVLQDAAIAYRELKPLDRHEVGSYIQRRLVVAGYGGPELFPPEAIGRIAQISRGVPRLINQICGTSLDLIDPPLGKIVSAETVEAALQSLPWLSPPDGADERLDASEARDDMEGLAGSACQPDPGVTAPQQETAGLGMVTAAPKTMSGMPPTPSDSTAGKGTMVFAEQRTSDMVSGTFEAIDPAEDRPAPHLRPATGLAPLMLTVPSRQTARAPRRGRAALLVALLLAGLVLGGIGTFALGLWSVSPEPILMAKETPANNPEASAAASEPPAQSDAAALVTRSSLNLGASAGAMALTEPANPPEPLPVAAPEPGLPSEPVAAADAEIIPKVPKSPEIDSDRESISQMADSGGGAPLALALAAADLDLHDLVMAREVVDREPVDVTTSFSSEDGRAFVHASIKNSGPPTQVSFLWLRGNALYTAVEMNVGTSMRWRTWSSAEVWLGEWRVQVVTANGKLLGEQSFSVE